MVRINSIGSLNNFIAQNKPSFKSVDNQTNPQIKELSNVSPDFAIKTPMTYSKTGEINFPYDTKAHCYKLANGQKVIIIPQEGATVLRTYVNTGSMNEPDNLRGISHYIEHNLFNGSKGLEEGDFFKQVNKMGADTNASTGFAETNYYISSNLLNDSDLENKIRLHASMIESPLFATEKLEKEKGIVNSEINMIVSYPVNLAVNKMLKNLYGVKSTSTDMIGGTTDNITNLKREDVVDYFNNNYYPANMVTVITGEVKPEETMKLISKYFTSRKQPANKRYTEPLTPTQKTVREDIISDKATATTIVVGFNGPSANNIKDRIYMDALSKLLTSYAISRIDSKIKDFNTGCSCEEEKFTTNPNDGRAIIFSAECADEKSENVLKVIFNEIGNIANNPPTDEEMQIIKKKLLNGFSEIFESTFATNNSIGTSVLENNEDYLKNFEQIVNSMTAKDLVETAKKYLDINKASVALVHPSSVNEEQIKKNHKAISFTGAKKEALNMDSVKEYNLPNNYRITTSNSKTNNVNMSFRVLTDNAFSSRPSAIYVLDYMLSQGSMFRNQDDFEKVLAKDGIDSGVTASANAINGRFTCGANDSVKAIKMLKEVIENPRFTQEELERAKNNISDKFLTAEKSAYEKLDAELYKGLPKGLTKEEILNDLETLTLEDVKNFYSSILKDGKGEIAISAPFDKQAELKNDTFRAFSEFQAVKPHSPKNLKDVYKPVEQAKVLLDTDFKNQAEIVQAYKFKVNQNIKDRATIELLNIILGGNASSRLFMDLREKEKLAYHVRSGFDFEDNIGEFDLRIGTTTDNKETGEQSFENLQKSIDGFKRHIEKIKSEKVSEEELNNAKLNLKNLILDSNSSAMAKNESLLSGMRSPYGLGRENLIFNEVDKITADDILNAAKYIFSGKPLYSIVATEDTLKANKEYLDKLVKEQ